MKKAKKPPAKKKAQPKPQEKNLAASPDTLRAAKLKAPKAVKAVRIEYLFEAKKFVPRVKIHPRRVHWKPPQGDPIADAAPTPALNLMPSFAMAAPGVAAAPSQEIVIHQATQLDSVAQQQTASHVCEPSVASNKKVVFYTGNWFAAVSLDGGATFQYLDPANSFPDPPGLSFCCDQVVHYIKKIDTFVWLLQYMEHPTTGENVQRLAFATTAEVQSGQWRFFDITSANLGLTGKFLDFPDLALGTNMLYVTTNAYDGELWHAAAIVRLPFSGVKNGNITAQHFVSQQNASFRVAQNCGARAFWGSHNSTSSFRVFFWDESAQNPSFRDVTVPSWARGTFVSKTPDNRNWLGRADTRLVGATKRGKELWFAWGSNRGGANSRPQPFVQIARIDSTDFSLIESINIWDPNFAVCYAALNTNTKNEVGVSYLIGGGARFPTHIVGILTGVRKEVEVFASVRGPKNHQCGDYLTIRRHGSNGRLFSATGFTLQPGSGTADSTPNYVLFGR